MLEDFVSCLRQSRYRRQPAPILVERDRGFAQAHTGGVIDSTRNCRRDAEIPSSPMRLALTGETAWPGSSIRMAPRSGCLREPKTAYPAHVVFMRGFLQWRWHLDEMYVKLNGEMVYLWRAVDHEGEVLESYVTKSRDKAAALTFMKKAIKRLGKVEAITTDGLRSYRAAMNELGCADKQEMGRWANNRVENSHLPLRRRERAMLRFRQMKSLQKFASVHGSIQNHFNQERHLIDRETFKARRSAALPSGSRSPAETCMPCPHCIVWRAVRFRLTPHPGPPRMAAHAPPVPHRTMAWRSISGGKPKAWSLIRTMRRIGHFSQ